MVGDWVFHFFREGPETMKNPKWGLEVTQWLKVLANFQRTQVWLSAPMSGNSDLPVTAGGLLISTATHTFLLGWGRQNLKWLYLFPPLLFLLPPLTPSLPLFRLPFFFTLSENHGFWTLKGLDWSYCFLKGKKRKERNWEVWRLVWWGTEGSFLVHLFPCQLVICRMCFSFLVTLYK